MFSQLNKSKAQVNICTAPYKNEVSGLHNTSYYLHVEGEY